MVGHSIMNVLVCHQVRIRALVAVKVCQNGSLSDLERGAADCQVALEQLLWVGIFMSAIHSDSSFEKGSRLAHFTGFLLLHKEYEGTEDESVIGFS